jgi:hypothetical protein
MEIEGSPFAASVSALGAAGSYTITIATAATTGHDGQYRYNLKITNAALSAQRTLHKGTITIAPRFAS